MSHNSVTFDTNQISTNNRVQLRRTLTLFQVVMMGLAYMQPMTIFDTFGIVSKLTDGHVATSYAIALIAILFTALSYGKLIKTFSVSRLCLYIRTKINESPSWVYGRLVIFAGLFAHADDQYPAGKNLSSSHFSRC